MLIRLFILYKLTLYYPLNCKCYIYNTYLLLKASYLTLFKFNKP